MLLERERHLDVRPPSSDRREAPMVRAAESYYDLELAMAAAYAFEVAAGASKRAALRADPQAGDANVLVNGESTLRFLLDEPHE